MALLFDIDDDLDKRLITKFEKFCGEPVIVKCFTNRLMYNSKYNSQIESKIDAVCKVAHADENIVKWKSWLDLLD